VSQNKVQSLQEIFATVNLLHFQEPDFNPKYLDLGLLFPDCAILISNDEYLIVGCAEE
jgi:hypothetical protein